jgi:hypothetical protein
MAECSSLSKMDKSQISKSLNLQILKIFITSDNNGKKVSGAIL